MSSYEKAAEAGSDVINVNCKLLQKDSAGAVLRQVETVIWFDGTAEQTAMERSRAGAPYQVLKRKGLVPETEAKNFFRAVIGFVKNFSSVAGNMDGIDGEVRIHYLSGDVTVPRGLKAGNQTIAEFVTKFCDALEFDVTKMVPLRKIKLVSSALIRGDGREPRRVEQHLTVSSAGRVYFQELGEELGDDEAPEVLMKRQGSIDREEAEDILRLVAAYISSRPVQSSGAEESAVPDIRRVPVRWELSWQGSVKGDSGVAWGPMTGAAVGGIDLSAFLRRRIPVRALFAFGGR